VVRTGEILHDNGWIEITCVMTHRDGHSERFTLRGPPDNSARKPAARDRLHQNLSGALHPHGRSRYGASDMDDADDRHRQIAGSSDSRSKESNSSQTHQRVQEFKADMSIKAEEAPPHCRRRGRSATRIFAGMSSPKTNSGGKTPRRRLAR